MSIKGFRKRILVSEGDLYVLFKEVAQIRKDETKALYRSKFRQLLKEAEFVDFTVTPKKENDD